MKKRFRCPTCKKEGDWLAGPYGPFCSRRCKLVDLGKWLGEEHVLSQPLRPKDLEGADAVRREVDPPERDLSANK